MSVIISLLHWFSVHHVELIGMPQPQQEQPDEGRPVKMACLSLLPLLVPSQWRLVAYAAWGTWFRAG